MSPEQALGLDDIDERTDIWSLCVVLYEVITGRVPFQKPNYNALMHAIINEDPPSSVECGAGDKGLWQIIERGLQKQRADRFQTVTELGEALALWLYEHGIKEDLSGNSIRAVWLDAGLSLHGGELRSARPAGYDASAGARAGASRSPTVPAQSSSAETLLTLPPRDAGRSRLLYVALPLGALLLGAAGTWLALRSSAPVASPALASPPPVAAPLPAPAALPAAPASEPSAVSDAPAASATAKASATAAAKPRLRAAPAPRKKGHDFGF